MSLYDSEPGKQGDCRPSPVIIIPLDFLSQLLRGTPVALALPPVTRHANSPMAKESFAIAYPLVLRANQIPGSFLLLGNLRFLQSLNKLLERAFLFFKHFAIRMIVGLMDLVR